MAKNTKTAKAGLVFMKDRDLDIVEAANHVASGFESMGHRITGVHILSDTTAQVSTDTHALCLETREDVTVSGSAEKAPVFLGLRLLGGDREKSKRFARDSLLARALQSLNASLEPDFVQWIDTDFLLPSDTFTSATEGAAAPPKALAKEPEGRVSHHKKLPDIESTNVILQDRITNHDPAIFENQSAPDRLRKIFSEGWVDPDALAAEEAAEAHAREMEDIEQEAPLRLSAWMLSFAVALFALPIGVMLMVLNLAKGENLRLASQTAALTGTFVALQAFGTTANAMTTLQSLIH